MYSAPIDRLPKDRVLRYASAPRRRLSWIESSIEACFRVAKGIILFAGLLMLVTVTAALVGCLFLSNGDIAYLVNPTSCFISFSTCVPV